jgi:hypothetical protein
MVAVRHDGASQYGTAPTKVRAAPRALQVVTAVVTLCNKITTARALLVPIANQLLLQPDGVKGASKFSLG